MQASPAPVDLEASDADTTGEPRLPAGVRVSHGPAFAMLHVDLSPGEPLTAESGSMVAMRGPVEMKVRLFTDRTAGFFGFLRALFVAFARKLVGGENFLVNDFSSAGGGTVMIAPTMAGQITHRRLRGESLVLRAGAYLASRGDVRVRVKFGGLRGLLSRQGLFFLECSGEGDLFFTTYGGIHAVEVRGGYVVDNGHLVGYEGSLQFGISSAGGGLMGLFASGEGLVCKFEGSGTVYLQSRNLTSLTGWLSPLLPS